MMFLLLVYTLSGKQKCKRKHCYNVSLGRHRPGKRETCLAYMGQGLGDLYSYIYRYIDRERQGERKQENLFLIVLHVINMWQYAPMANSQCHHDLIEKISPCLIPLMLSTRLGSDKLQLCKVSVLIRQGKASSSLTIIRPPGMLREIYPSRIRLLVYGLLFKTGHYIFGFQVTVQIIHSFFYLQQFK